jgi:microcystin-dependent protein
MANPFLGEIRLLPFTFAPSGWAFCQGQILAISQNTALFSILGTTYGGNGTTNFALPNLKGSVAIGAGQGPGLSNRFLGEATGEVSHTLLQSEMPAHTHPLSAFMGRGGSPSGTPVAGGALTASSGGLLFDTTAVDVAAPAVIGTSGSSAAHNNLMPYLGLNYCIALQGVFPARN